MDEQISLDRKRLIGKVAERHGIQVSEDDPVFYLLSLNEFWLEEATQDIVAKIQNAGRDFEAAFDRVQQRAGQFLAQQTKQCSTVPDRSGRVTAGNLAVEWKLAGTLAALLIFTLGILVGLALKW